MDRELEIRIRRETASPDSAQLGGLTLGIKNIMHSRKIVLAANGGRKARIINTGPDAAHHSGRACVRAPAFIPPVK